jgi:hypothetical protein
MEQKTCHRTKFEQSIVPQAQLDCEPWQGSAQLVQNKIICTNTVQISAAIAYLR